MSGLLLVVWLPAGACGSLAAFGDPVAVAPDTDLDGTDGTDGTDGADGTSDTDRPAEADTDAVGETADPGPAPTCGDGVKDGADACDGADLGGATCLDYGFDSGALTCDGGCRLVTSACYDAPRCGDRVRNGSEACEGADFGGVTCATFGFDSGALTCTGACAINSSACFDAPVCGDGVKNGADACDGADLGGATCATYGFTNGSVSCTGSCAINTSACNNNAACGDGVKNGSEACDGADLGGQSCASQGFDGGSLSCGGCALVYSSCWNASPGGSWCNSTAFDISSSGTPTVTSDIVVPAHGALSTVKVTVQGTHDWMGDLEFALVRSGTTRVLGDPYGQIGDDCGQSGTIDVAFADAFSAAANTCSIYGDYQGNRKSKESLSVFSSPDMAGTWTLRVRDTQNFDGGRISKWCVVVNP